MTYSLLEGHFVHEPRDDAYSDLLRAVARMATRILLPVGDSPQLYEDSQSFLSKLEPWCRLAERRGEWPGTKIGGTRLVKEYEVSDELIKIIEDESTGLYENGDIAFLRSDGSPILYVIAHEEEAHLSVTEQERDQLTAAGVVSNVEWYAP
jgi:hypothetical protein